MYLNHCTTTLLRDNLLRQARRGFHESSEPIKSINFITYNVLLGGKLKEI